MRDAPSAAWIRACEAALILVADIVVVLVLQRQQVLDAAGVALGWWALVLPAILTCVLASLAARRLSATAVPFGPNAVFVMAFAAVLVPLGSSLCATADTCHAQLGGFLGASLVCYGVLTAILTIGALRLDLAAYRRVMLMPLAAICWVYLLAVPALRIAQTRVSIMLPAIVLFVLLVLEVRGFIAWAVSGVLWAGLAWVTHDFPSGASAEAVMLTPAGAFGWLVRGEFWVDVLPILAPLSIANAFGIIENIAAVREVGDRVSAPQTLAIVTAGTLGAAALGTAAPSTVYVGHTALRRRGAGWAYSVCAVPLLVLIGLFGDRLVTRLPTPIFVGAIAYLGVAVGMLPRKHLHGALDVARAVLVGVPVAAMAFGSGPFGVWLGRGGGLTSVGWSFMLLAPAGSMSRSWAAVAMAAASILGLTHALPFTLSGAIAAGCYAGLAIAFRVRRGHAMVGRS